MFLLFQGCPAASIGMIPTHREGRVTQRSGRGVRGVRASVRAKKETERVSEGMLRQMRTCLDCSDPKCRNISDAAAAEASPVQ